MVNTTAAHVRYPICAATRDDWHHQTQSPLTEPAPHLFGVVLDGQRSDILFIQHRRPQLTDATETAITT